METKDHVPVYTNQYQQLCYQKQSDTRMYNISSEYDTP